MSARVQGKRVLITGAARGMGRSHAVRLAQEGADVILVDICESLPVVDYPLATTEDLAETARLVHALGRRAVTHVVDVRDMEALTAAVDDGVAHAPGDKELKGQFVATLYCRRKLSLVKIQQTHRGQFLAGLQRRWSRRNGFIH